MVLLPLPVLLSVVLPVMVVLSTTTGPVVVLLLPEELVVLRGRRMQREFNGQGLASQGFETFCGICTQNPRVEFIRYPDSHAQRYCWQPGQSLFWEGVHKLKLPQGFGSQGLVIFVWLTAPLGERTQAVPFAFETYPALHSQVVTFGAWEQLEPEH
jgi:hypothetical protein